MLLRVKKAVRNDSAVEAQPVELPVIYGQHASVLRVEGVAPQDLGGVKADQLDETFREFRDLTGLKIIGIT